MLFGLPLPPRRLTCQPGCRLSHVLTGPCQLGRVLPVYHLQLLPMIGFLLELAAFQVGMNYAYQHAANKARRKYVKAVEAQFREFARWAEKNPHHPLIQQVNAEGLALNQCLTISPAERAEKTLAIVQNAYRLMRQVPQWPILERLGLLSAIIFK